MTLHEETHQAFLGRLDDSRRAVMVVAAMLTAKKMQVLLPGELRSPTFEGRKDFTDDGDLFARRSPQKPWKRLEVRHHVDAEWTSADTWPPRNVYGCIVGPVECDSPEITGWYHLNGPMTHYYFIHHQTREHWVKKAVKDKGPSESKVNYFCPLELVVFGSI